MALSHDFRETVARHAQKDLAFREALIEEILQAVKDGELTVALDLL